jgi:hypothetical protein
MGIYRDMKYIKLFEAYNTPFTEELPQRVSAPSGEYVFAELCDGDTGDCLLGIVDDSTLQDFQNTLDEEFMAGKILDSMTEGRVVPQDAPVLSYYVRNFDQSVLKGRKRAFVSFFCNCHSCNSETSEVLMGYKNNSGLGPDKKTEGNITSYGNLFAAGQNTIIIHKGDKYLLEHAPLQSIKEYPGELKSGFSHTYTMQFKIGQFYRQPYPGDPYEEIEFLDISNTEDLERVLEEGDAAYDHKRSKMNEPLLKEILGMLLNDPRAPQGSIDLIRDYFRTNP